MALHDTIRALVATRGEAVLADADEFRAALDDFLAEEEATTGELSLLYDAVRLDAVRRMLATLDHGGSADRTLREAGAALARDRGSVEVDRACWALATLGFALDRVPSTTVEHYRSLLVTEESPEARPTTPPPLPPTVPPPTEPRPAPVVAAPEPRRSFSTGVVLAAVAVALVLGAIAASAVVLLRDDDAQRSADGTDGGESDACSDVAEAVEVTYTLVDDASLPGVYVYPEVTVTNGTSDPVSVRLEGSASVTTDSGAETTTSWESSDPLEAPADDTVTHSFGADDGLLLDEDQEIVDTEVEATADSADGDASGCAVGAVSTFAGTPDTTCSLAEEQFPGAYPDTYLKVKRRYAHPEETKVVQQQLNFLGYPCTQVDGDFGPVTSGLVRDFQADHRLVEDGEVGPQTWEALFPAG